MTLDRATMDITKVYVHAKLDYEKCLCLSYCHKTYSFRIPRINLKLISN